MEGGKRSESVGEVKERKPRFAVSATGVASMGVDLNSLILSIFLSLNNKTRGCFFL